MDKNYRFGIYNHKIVFDNDKLITKTLIVLKCNNDIVAWTDFHKFCKGGKIKMAHSIYSNDELRCRNVVGLLNYIFFDKYNIAKLSDITSKMVCDYLNDFGMCRLKYDNENTHRSKNTVNVCIGHIMDFITLLVNEISECQININDFYKTETYFSKQKKKYLTKKVPVFDVYYKPFNKKIFRDIPEEAFQIIMNEILVNHTNILMLAALGAFAGLRPSEACNVRREDSNLGPGLRFEYVDGEVTNIYIDLTEEKNLRSDLKRVGGIKKERIQKVYPTFLNAFIDCYSIYMTYINGRKYEADYGALTNTSFGKAYTYDAYYKEFKNVISDCIPIMLKSDNPQTVNYGHLLQEHNISPHIFRHWFSVKLTLYGENVAGLMNWRGDKSPESALTYLSNKSDLERQLNLVTDEIFNYSLWKAGKIKNEC